MNPIFFIASGQIRFLQMKNDLIGILLPKVSKAGHTLMPLAVQNHPVTIESISYPSILQSFRLIC